MIALPPCEMDPVKGNAVCIYGQHIALPSPSAKKYAVIRQAQEETNIRTDTTPAGARDLSMVWDQTRERIHALLQNRPEITATLAVDTVPGTTVGDVLAHLIGTATRATDDPAALCGVALTPPSAGTADAQSSVTDLLDTWEKAANAVRAQIAVDAELASVMITDAVMGEHDLRTAIGAPGARDDVAVKVALDELSGRFSDRVASAKLPPLRVTVEQWGTIAGDGRAISCVVADRFEFVRAMSGRRSAPEIRQWNWGVEPDAYLPVISEVGLPEREIHERDPRIPEHMRDREFVL